jgi:hypothetical protein
MEKENNRLFFTHIREVIEMVKKIYNERRMKKLREKKFLGENTNVKRRDLIKTKSKNRKDVKQ